MDSTNNSNDRCVIFGILDIFSRIFFKAHLPFLLIEKYNFWYPTQVITLYHRHGRHLIIIKMHCSLNLTNCKSLVSTAMVTYQNWLYRGDHPTVQLADPIMDHVVCWSSRLKLRKYYLKRKKLINIFFLSLLNGRILSGSKNSLQLNDENLNDGSFVHIEADREFDFRIRNRRLGDDALTTALSAFYAKLLVVLGIAFPVTEILSEKAPAAFYQGFYLYLYVVSVAFVAFMYYTYLRAKAMLSAINSLGK